MGLAVVVRNVSFVDPLWRDIFQGSVGWFPVPRHTHHSSFQWESDVDSVYCVESEVWFKYSHV